MQRSKGKKQGLTDGLLDAPALWVNPDGSHASTVLAHSASDDALILTGDVDAYNRAHPDAPVSEVVSDVISLSLSYWRKNGLLSARPD